MDTPLGVDHQMMNFAPVPIRRQLHFDRVSHSLLRIAAVTPSGATASAKLQTAATGVITFPMR